MLLLEQLVAIGPHSRLVRGNSPATAGLHPPGSLKSFGCPVEEQDFHAPSTPVGDVAMKNIVVKIPSANPTIILLTDRITTQS